MEYSNKELVNEFSEILFYFDDVKNAFSRKVYVEYFEKFCERTNDLYSSIEETYINSEEKQAFLTEIARFFVKKAESKLKRLNKRKREIKVFEYNLSLVTYIFPSLLKFKKHSTDELSKEIEKLWNDMFPKQKVQVTSYEDINGGFKKKFCYITTATCKALNKTNDCEELELFRNFRDNYLEKCDNGMVLIKKYYNLAPSIIKGIEKEKDFNSVYKYIWDKYLFNCCNLIKKNENELCKNKYEEMVKELSQKYIYK